ncbi:probable 28S rRNA (cytosine-C(5))-methyltransferase [Cimex lectularius]|uniref:SAM-dependent MTase RsmB/NOP-type domain-containing protein n=1 Tax=Cimex lectularius TaxID=79782 RepID=A0A8I6RED5_CIMLE|nr:probable 28S rRNA (cytosine-C(5))-methyltransferase [Cimex lectularius]
MYTSAAIIAENCVEKGLGLKYQLYNREYLKDKQNVASVSFLVQNCLKRKAEIDDLIKNTGLFQMLTKNDIWLARILVVELVLGRKSFKCTDKISKIVYKYKKRLRELGSGMKVENKAIPRYVRINLLKTNLEPALSQLKEKGFLQLETPKELNGFYEKLKNLKEKEFMLDFHVPALLVFHPKTKFFNFEWVLNGSFILQDKSSCMVSPLLSPHPGSLTLDMCAAPGYKTLHLATYLQNVGDIICVDRSKDRFANLLKLKKALDLTNVHCFNQDAFDDNFGSFNKNDISYIILDPPCSGSGIVKNYDYEESPTNNSKRLNSLHNLQSKLLRRALTDFPSARRVVYSTCSLTVEEDEEVIEEFIQPPNGFTLVNLSSFYYGVSTGDPKYKCGTFCIKMRPDRELTNGFFIAMFERINPKESVSPKRNIHDSHEIISIGTDENNPGSFKKAKIDYKDANKKETLDSQNESSGEDFKHNGTEGERESRDDVSNESEEEVENDTDSTGSKSDNQGDNNDKNDTCENIKNSTSSPQKYNMSKGGQPEVSSNGDAGTSGGTNGFHQTGEEKRRPGQFVRKRKYFKGFKSF